MPEFRNSTLSGLLETLERENEENEWFNLDASITIGHDDEEDEWVAIVDLDGSGEPDLDDDELGAEQWENEHRTLGTTPEQEIWEWQNEQGMEGW